MVQWTDHRFEPGQPVICEVTKHSSRPGPRAKNIEPEPRGEGYRYQVDKLWVVADAAPDGRAVLRTRRGKEHVLRQDDPRLRRPHWWERLLYRHRFPHLRP